MLQFIYSVLAFIVAIGLLIAVHEFGHFWVARRMGVKVLRFCLGFGKPLISWHDKDGTEYAIAAIPLGGYVRMLDQTEGIVAPNELHMAFNNKPIWARALVIAAGPIFNLLFAIAAYWLMFCIGVATIAPILGDIPKGSVADLAGLHSGQQIVMINQQKVSSWEDVAVNLMSQVGESHYINIGVTEPGNTAVSNHALNLSNWSLENNDENIIRNLGLEPIDPVAPIVGSVMPDMPAAKVGLKSGDKIIKLNGVDVDSRAQLMSLLRDKYEQNVHLTVLRDNSNIDIYVKPVKKVLDGGDVVGFIGIQFAEQPLPANFIHMQRYGVVAAFTKAVQRTGEYSLLTLQFLKKMVVGQMSLQHVAGPISIAKFAGRTAASGVEYFLGFLALVSISLGVLNLLPIPVLDGGHLLYCAIELVTGKPLSQRALQMANTFGVAVLGSFMVLAIYNDILRIFN